MATEMWLPVVGYEGAYEVSDAGRVRNSRTGLMRVPTIDRHGYPYYDLWSENRRKHRRAHLLVAEAFIGPRQPGQVIRHLDGDPGNNRPENLAYGSQSENMLDAVRHGRNVQAAQSHCRNGHLFTAENTYLIPPERRRRDCRTCATARKLAHYRRTRQKSAA